MTRPLSRCFICLAAGAALLLHLSNVDGHGVALGRTAAGQLKVHVEVHQPIFLPPSLFPGVTGYADFDPGLASLEIEEPKEDLFFLDLKSNIQFEFLGADPGVQIVTDHVMVPGETLLVGSPPFDFHLVFNIPGGPLGESHSLSFRFNDLNGIHASSDPVTLRFAATETPCHCRGDVDKDKALAGRDVQAFLDCFLTTTPAEVPDSSCFCADMNGDGLLDEEDAEHFVEHLLEGDECS